MLLTQDQEMIRDAVRAFAQEQLWPNAARWDKEHHFPKDAHQGLAALGAYGICVPEEYGGANLDYLTLALVLEEIAAGDGGTSTAISVTNCPVNAILMRYGNEAQKKQWLTPLAQGEMLGAFCLTEPHVGSDASRPAHHGREGGRRLRASTASSSSSPAARTATWPSSSPSPTRARARRA
jgi:butyryl-CoA dehydrogenase